MFAPLLFFYIDLHGGIEEFHVTEIGDKLPGVYRMDLRYHNGGCIVVVGFLANKIENYRHYGNELKLVLSKPDKFHFSNVSYSHIVSSSMRW